MKRLCVIAPDKGVDTGWGRYTKEVVRVLRERYEVTLITDLREPTDMYRRPDCVFKEVIKLRPKLRGMDGLLSLITYPYSLIAYLATRGTKIPYFVCSHGTYAVKPLHDWECLGAKHTLRHASGIFPVSQFTANQISKVLPDLDTIHVTRNGIRPENFERADPFDIDHRVMLSVAPFKKRKGQKIAVEGFATVADEIPNTHFHLVGGGDGHYREAVLEVIAQNDLEDRVHLEGYVSDDDLRRWYETADLFVLTSQYTDNHRFEGFPLVYLEAQRYGLPVLGIESTSASEAIDHGSSGLCVENTPKAIGEGIQRVFTDDDFYTILSTGAEEWAYENSWEKVVDQITAVIDETLEIE